MKKKQKSKKQLLKSVRLSTVIITLLVVSQTISAYYIFKNREYMMHDSQRFMTSFINSTEEKRYKYPIIDVTENRVYIPEARLYLPLNPTTRDLRYEYSSAFDKPMLYLSMRGIVGNQKQTEAATCDKMISFTKEKTGSTDLESEIEPTKDGFRFIYSHPKCDIYHGTVKEDLAESAREVKNY